MATPFAEFANARIAWRKPTAPPTSLRGGTRPEATTTIVLEAFLEPGDGTGGTASRGVPGGDTTLQFSGARSFTGYITRWATLPEDAGWLDAGTGWSWDDSGLRPDGLAASSVELQAALVDMGALPDLTRAVIGAMVLTQLGSQYGPGGIGAEITSVAGEYLEVRFTTR